MRFNLLQSRRYLIKISILFCCWFNTKRSLICLFRGDYSWGRFMNFLLFTTFPNFIIFLNNIGTIALPNLLAATKFLNTVDIIAVRWGVDASAGYFSYDIESLHLLLCHLHVTFNLFLCKHFVLNINFNLFEVKQIRITLIFFIFKAWFHIFRKSLV